MVKKHIDPQTKYRSIMPISKVKELSELNPIIPVRDTIIVWLLIISCWVAAATFNSWLVTFGLIPVIGILYYSLYIIGHDGMHLRIFPDMNKNNLFTDVFIFAPIGAITRINKKNHMTHHRHLGTEKDPDIYKHSCSGKDTAIGLLFFLTGFQKIYESLFKVYLNKKPNEEKTNSKSAYKFFDVALLIGWQVSLFVGLTYFVGWFAYPLLWLGPVYVTILLDNVRSFSEHSHPESDEHADEHRLITFLPNIFEKWVFAPMNMHHHVAHHLWPSIPYYNLPKATKIIQEHEQADELEWRKSYFSHLFHWIKQTPITDCHEGHNH